MVSRVSWFVALVAVLIGVGAVPAGAAPRYPVTPTILIAFAQAAPDPSASPAGVNVPGCRPSAAHPRPVILVNGTFANMIDDWSGLGPTLANQGYCVYSTSLGADSHSFVQTTGPIATSARELAAFVAHVRSVTHAAQVDLVGHSQGGMLAEYYVKLLGGRPFVHTVVGISPSTHGTTLDGLSGLARAIPGASGVLRAGCAACDDQLVGSPALAPLDRGPIAQPGVAYTVIETHNETVVTPAGSSFIREPGVHNVWLQDVCPLDYTDHVDLTYDQGVYGLVHNALDPAHPSPVRCV